MKDILHMKQIPFSRIRSVILILAFCILLLGIGYRLGERRAQISITSDKRVVINQQPTSSTVDFSLFWDVWQRLTRSYIDKSALDPQKMVWGAISGMVGALGDPYTIFLPPTDNKDFKSNLGGQFEGIGAQLGLKDGHIIIIAPLKGMPAEKAGIKAGDYILKVNDEDTTGWTVEQAVAKIRGPKGTKVALQILHEGDGKPIDISVMRDTITVSSVESWIKQPSDIKEIAGVSSYKTLSAKTGKVAYILLSRFGDNTNDDWAKAVTDVSTAYATDKTIKGLIFDLRSNPGGYLESAVYIGSEFIKSGTVVSQVNSDGSRQDYPVEHTGKLLTIPVVVLINKGSASAAEIVAGALRDYKRAILVGETSFGKGSVQTPEDLSDGSGLHITTGKWLLPKGDSISKKGIVPDVVVSSDDVSATADAQLAKAVELLLK
jgi:carboxyl-terminal processing protease